jgi:hypothetical protein
LGRSECRFAHAFIASMEMRLARAIGPSLEYGSGTGTCAYPIRGVRNARGRSRTSTELRPWNSRSLLTGKPFAVGAGVGIHGALRADRGFILGAVVGAPPSSTKRNRSPGQAPARS